MNNIPTFYDPERIGKLFYPDTQLISKQAEEAGLKAAQSDDPQVMLLLVDMQIDFCHTQGALYTPGALDDIKRVIDFIFRNASRLSHITCSMDSHYPFQIFHPPWWVDADGKHPPPFTVITKEDVQQGKWIPVREEEWSRAYVEKLEQKSKKQLLIWPYHVPVGAAGHLLDPELWSVVFWHGIARQNQPVFWQKGTIPETEHYSVLQPEIPVTDKPESGLSTDFVGLLNSFDYVVIAGEAASHCVQETVKDIVAFYGEGTNELKKFIVLEDCTSPVQHPEIDFDKLTREQFETFKKQGVSFQKSTAPLPF